MLVNIWLYFVILVMEGRSKEDPLVLRNKLKKCPLNYTNCSLWENFKKIPRIIRGVPFHILPHANEAPPKFT